MFSNCDIISLLDLVTRIKTIELLSAKLFLNRRLLMKNLRAYYSETIETFLRQSNAEIIGIIHRNCISADIRFNKQTLGYKK